MSDEKHKSELTSLAEELMADIDSKPLHPKNIKSSSTVDMFCRNYHGILPLLVYQKPGSLKILIPT